jgi:hypothetical protein
LVEHYRVLDLQGRIVSAPAAERGGDEDGYEPTVASVWHGVAGRPITDDLLDWPPDLFALTDLILERAEVYRFVLSPPIGVQWPPVRFADWPTAVQDAARAWSVWAQDRDGALPDLVAEEWAVVRERSSIPLEQLASGQDWRMCEAFVTLHTIADEACAGVFVALDRSDGQGLLYRARGRELLARTGSLARIHPGFVQVLPKIRTPPSGKAGFARYACVQSPGIRTRWHKLPARHPGTSPAAEHVNMLLLPWPLRVRESDFRAVDGSVQRLSNEPYGFFEFAPAEGLDLDLLDRTLVAAAEEVESVDAVILPESAIDQSEIADLEAVLDHHGVVYLQAGVRERSAQPGRFGSNWMHIGVSPGLEKGGLLPSSPYAPWFHIRQNKHHRWALDEGQVLQYHLGGALHPKIVWWEAIDVPRMELQFLQVGEEVTIVSLVCEDLAQNDDVAEVIRAVGPTIVSTALLDGPQLTSRWAARYASVLADDPGSAVLTLTSFGMAQRSQPSGRDPSPVVALLKDADRGTRELSLKPGSHGVLLTLSGERATRRSADGRWPVTTGTHYSAVAVHQIRAAGARPGEAPLRAAPGHRLMEAEEITILTGWAEAVAEALAYVPARAHQLLVDAGADAPWRDALALAAPTPLVIEAIASIDQALVASTPAGGAPSFDAVLTAVQENRPDELPLDRLTRRVLRSALEQLRTRQGTTVADQA